MLRRTSRLELDNEIESAEITGTRVKVLGGSISKGGPLAPGDLARRLDYNIVVANEPVGCTLP